MCLRHYRCFIKSLLCQGSWADPCHICQVIFEGVFLFRVGAQLVQRGAIQQDNYCKILTYALWACKWISAIISPLARIFNNCNPAFFFTRNRLVKCHVKCKLINKQKDIMDVYYSALLCLTWHLIQIPGSDFLLGLGAEEACDWHDKVAADWLAKLLWNYVHKYWNSEANIWQLYTVYTVPRQSLYY